MNYLARILVDLDGTLANTPRATLDHLSRHGFDITLPRTFRFEDEYPAVKPVIKKLYRSATFYESIEPFAGVRDVMTQLMSWGYVSIVTARPFSVRLATKRWLDRWKIPCYDVVFSSRKASYYRRQAERFRFCYIIDDCPHFVEPVVDLDNVRCYMPRWTYNESYRRDGVQFIGCLDEALNDIAACEMKSKPVLIKTKHVRKSK